MLDGVKIGLKRIDSWKLKVENWELKVLEVSSEQARAENWEFSKYGATKVERLKCQASKFERKIDSK